jgi:Zn-dependent protease
VTLFVLQNPDYTAIILAFFLLVAFPFHEFCHAFAAWRLGDDTARHAGKLTLNPIAHFHPVGGTILIVSTLLYGMPLGFALTPVNPARLRGRHGEAIVAVAGPLSNWVTAIVFGLAFRYAYFNVDAPYRLYNLLYILTETSLALAIFNLLPVPPLDGSAILLALLPPRARFRIEPAFRQYGMLLFLGVFLLGGYVLKPVVDGLFNTIAGLPPGV